ncbi:hypothetical protein KEM48_008285, partial [Puccinia striiformis f. sp. tritici PST-130]
PDPLALFNQVDVRKELLDQLRLKRLPALRRQIISLSNTLQGQSDLQAQPLPKLQLVLKILSKLDATMGKIKFAIACICPDLQAQEVTHDRDFKDLKQLMCSRVAMCTLMMTGRICGLLSTSGRFIKESGHGFNRIAQKRTEFLKATNSCLRWIDDARKLTNESELSLVQGLWKSNIDKINQSLEHFLQFMRSQAPSSGGQGVLVGRDITKSMTAILRLSRLLYAKLLRLSVDRENFRMVTNLSSRELDMFAKVATTPSGSIDRLVNALCGRLQDPINTQQVIKNSLCEISEAPEHILHMVEHIFVPVVHHKADQPSSKFYYKASFINGTQLTSRSFEHSPSLLVSR